MGILSDKSSGFCIPRVAKQKEEIAAQQDNLGKVISELKSTQNQFIQSQKIASPDGLTAGNAHEIQNPLNFVNNFAEVSAWLIDDMEYLRLSYHGLSGKDKSFNATLQTDFDSSIGKINIILRDVGRVIPDKIFQPFFISKPVGEGLSSGYDNIRAHRGELIAERKDWTNGRIII